MWKNTSLLSNHFTYHYYHFLILHFHQNKLLFTVITLKFNDFFYDNYVSNYVRGYGDFMYKINSYVSGFIHYFHNYITKKK